MQTRSRKSQRYNRLNVASAFTLVETMLALTITALLVGSIVSATRTLTDSRKTAERRMERLTEARRAMNAIVAELRNVRRDVIADHPAIVGHTSGPDVGNDRIDLLVTSDRRSRPDGAESDQYEVSFYLIRSSERRQTVLVQRKDHALDDHPDEGGIATVVAEGILALAFEYYTGSEWENEWSQLAPEAPEAVRVTVVAGNSDGDSSVRPADTITLSTVVRIGVTNPAGAGERDRSGQTGTERPKR